MPNPKYNHNRNKDWIENRSSRRGFLKIGGKLLLMAGMGGSAVITLSKPARDGVANFLENLSDSESANEGYIKALKLGDTTYIISKKKIIYEIAPTKAEAGEGYASLVSRINPDYNKARIQQVSNLAHQINGNPKISALEDGIPIPLDGQNKTYTGLNLGGIYLIPKGLEQNEIKNRKLEWLLE